MNWRFGVPRVLATLVGVALVCACSAKADHGGGSDETADTTDEPTAEGDAAAGTNYDSTSGGPGTSTAASGTESDTDDPCGEGCRPDVPSDQACDVIEQNCPEGEKCTPYASEGGTYWDATHCVPADPEGGGPGDPCTAEAPTSGFDDCGPGSMCLKVDPRTLTGVCVEFCSGDMHPYACSDPLAHCHVANDGVLAVCVTDCNPVKQDCGDGQGCYPEAGAFHCGWDVSGEGGALGSPCEGHAACDPGLLCAPGDRVPKCGQDPSCCAEFCDPGVEPHTCWGSQEGVSCVPVAEAGVNGKDVGVCLLP